MNSQNYNHKILTKTILTGVLFLLLVNSLAFGLAPAPLLANPGEAAEVQASMICRVIEERISAGIPIEYVYFDDIQRWIEANRSAEYAGMLKNIQMRVLAHELWINIPDGSMVRYFSSDPDLAVQNLTFSTSHYVDIQTVEVNPRVKRQIVRFIVIDAQGKPDRQEHGELKFSGLIENFRTHPDRYGARAIGMALKTDPNLKLTAEEFGFIVDSFISDVNEFYPYPVDCLSKDNIDLSEVIFSKLETEQDPARIARLAMLIQSFLEKGIPDELPEKYFNLLFRKLKCFKENDFKLLYISDTIKTAMGHIKDLRPSRRQMMMVFRSFEQAKDPCVVANLSDLLNICMSFNHRLTQKQLDILLEKYNNPISRLKTGEEMMLVSVIGTSLCNNRSLKVTQRDFNRIMDRIIYGKKMGGTETKVFFYAGSVMIENNKDLVVKEEDFMKVIGMLAKEENTKTAEYYGYMLKAIMENAKEKGFYKIFLGEVIKTKDPLALTNMAAMMHDITLGGEAFQGAEDEYARISERIAVEDGRNESLTLANIAASMLRLDMALPVRIDLCNKIFRTMVNEPDSLIFWIYADTISSFLEADKNMKLPENIFRKLSYELAYYMAHYKPVDSMQLKCIARCLSVAIENDKDLRVPEAFIEDLLGLDWGSIEDSETGSEILVFMSRAVRKDAGLFETVFKLYAGKSEISKSRRLAILLSSVMVSGKSPKVNKDKFIIALDKLMDEKSDIEGGLVTSIVGGVVGGMLKNNPELFPVLLEYAEGYVASDKCTAICLKNGGELSEEIQELNGLLADRNEFKKLLFVLSIMRLAFRNIYEAQYNVSTFTPLEYARLHGMIFKYNDFLEICPVSGGSFRRHILIVKGRSGKKHLLEIKIPGQEDDRDFIKENHFFLSKRFCQKYGKAGGMVSPEIMVTAYGNFRMYHKTLEYNRKKWPIGAVVFDYQDGRRIWVRDHSDNIFLDREYIKRVADENNISEHVLYKKMVRQIIVISKRLLDLGYIGSGPGGTDWHLENFKLLPDGNVVAVADLGAFTKKRLSDKQKRSQIQMLLRSLTYHGDIGFSSQYKDTLWMMKRYPFKWPAFKPVDSQAASSAVDETDKTGMLGLIKDNEPLIKTLLKNNRKPVRLRVPVQALMSDNGMILEGLEKAKEFLQAFNNAPNGYVDIYDANSILKSDNVSNAAREILGSNIKTLPENVDWDRDNTITLLPVSDRETITRDNILMRLGDEEAHIQNTIVLPIGTKNDPLGPIRGAIFGLRLIDIVRHMEELKTVDEAFVDETVKQYEKISKLQGVEGLALTRFDIMNIALGDGKRFIISLNKLIKYLPITPLDTADIERVYECARLVLAAA